MAIYEPPKRSAAGGIISSSGDALMSTGGAMALAGAAGAGIGAIPGLVVAGAGAIGKVVGTIMSGNQEKKQEAYEAAYQNQVVAEENLLSQKQTNESLMAQLGGKMPGVNSSVQAINNYMTPSGGGTGIINKRLI